MATKSGNHRDLLGKSSNIFLGLITKGRLGGRLTQNFHEQIICLGTDGVTKTDEFSEKFQRGGGVHISTDI